MKKQNSLEVDDISKNDENRRTLIFQAEVSILVDPTGFQEGRSYFYKLC